MIKSDINIFDVVQIGHGQLIFVKDEILAHLQKYVVDYLVIRKTNGPSDDGLVNDVIQKKSPREERMPLALYEFLTETTGNQPTSLSSCGERKPFELRAYINTKRTPREERITNHMYKYLKKTFTFLMPHLAK